MAIETKEDLKARFETNDVITETSMSTFIDSTIVEGGNSAGSTTVVAAVNIGDNTLSSGSKGSFAQGTSATASGSQGSFAQGFNVTATGNQGNFAQGNVVEAIGNAGSFAQGAVAYAQGANGSFAQGNFVTASGSYGSFAQGGSGIANTKALGDVGSFAQGLKATASGDYGSFAQGSAATASAQGSWAVGSNVKSTNVHSMTFGIDLANDTDYSIEIGSSVTKMRICSQGEPSGGAENGDIWFDGADLKFKINDDIKTVTAT